MKPGRICSHCKKNEAQFECSTGRKRYHCKECMNDFTKLSKDKRTTQNKEFVNKLKEEPCMDCGNRFPPECMDFDHRVQEKKVNNIAAMLRASTLEKIKEEIAKCDLVCSNCHRIRTKFGWDSGKIKQKRRPVSAPVGSDGRPMKQVMYNGVVYSRPYR